MASSRSTPGFVHTRPPHFLAVGRLCYDLRGTDRTLGGSCVYSAILARNLGYPCAIVTSVGNNFAQEALPPDIRLAMQIGEETTTFINRPTLRGRVQHVRSISSPIRTTSMPKKWLEATIVYLCPILDDFDPSLVDLFPASLIGLAPQGWMRRIGQDGRVAKRRFEALREVVPKSDFVILSEEDVCSEDLPELVQLASAMVLTRGRSGAELFWNEGQYHEHIPAFVRKEVDETGAGDVFGAAFLLKYHETLDLHESAIFASWMASFVVRDVGTNAIPGEDQAALWAEAIAERPLTEVSSLDYPEEEPSPV